MEPSISELIASAERGDRNATDALFAALYSELHRMAARQLARSGGGLTLGVTTLLHEAYLDISGRDAEFPDRARFMAYASRVMRGLIVDYARNRKAQKHGGGFEITSIESDVADPAGAEARELERLNGALEELAAVEPELAQLVDLKFFCGFSFAEIAAIQRRSERTVQRHWEKARIYLHHWIRGMRSD